MKKIISLNLILLLTIILAACTGSKVDDETAKQYFSQSEQVVSLLNDKQYEELHELFNDELKSHLSIANLEEISPYIEEAGDFMQIDKKSIQKKEEVYITVLVAKYSEKNRVFTINYNEEKEIIGLFVK